MKQYLNIILSLFLAFTACQPAFAQTKVDGSLLKGDVIGGTASNTRRIVVPKDTKANLDAKTRLEANLVYGTDTKKAYIDNGTDLIAVGSGSGGAVNLITDGDAENATSSIFIPYADAAASRPVDGVGSSADVTTAVTSTAPLTGAKSFTITKDAVNRQGQGWSIPFTVPLSMQAKVLQIEVDYIVNSGTFVAGSSSADSDVIWYLYDITNSTLIEPSSIKVLSSSSTLSDKFRSTFQTSATGTSYRLIAHVATTSAAAYELKVEASVSPSVYVYGTPITDWASYTTGCTGAWVTNTTYSCKKRRVGDNYEYNIKLATSGAPTATALLINIPDTVDTAKINSTLSYASALENSSIAYDSGNGYPVKVSYYSTTQVAVTNNASPQALVAHNVPFTFGAGDEINIRFSLPIVGLSSSVQMSDSADTRLMTARYKTAAGQSIPNSTFTIVDFGTKDFDTHGLVTTGASWKFTAISSGYFRIGTHIRVSTALNAVNFAARIYKNGAAGPAIADTSTDNSASGRGDITGSTIVELVAGDYVDIRVVQNSGGAVTLLSDADYVYIDIEKLSGPSAIAASESVNLSYSSNTSGSIGTSATLQSFTTKVYDSHGAWSGSVFTAPIAGKYRISTNILTANVALGTTQELNALVYKNGSLYRRLDTKHGTGNGQSYGVQGSTTIDLLSGETLSIYGQSAVATTQQGGGTFTFITIEKVGN